MFVIVINTIKAFFKCRQKAEPVPDVDVVEVRLDGLVVMLVIPEDPEILEALVTRLLPKLAPALLFWEAVWLVTDATVGVLEALDPVLIVRGVNTGVDEFLTEVDIEEIVFAPNVVDRVVDEFVIEVATEVTVFVAGAVVKFVEESVLEVVPEAREFVITSVETLVEELVPSVDIVGATLVTATDEVSDAIGLVVTVGIVTASETDIVVIESVTTEVSDCEVIPITADTYVVETSGVVKFNVI